MTANNPKIGRRAALATLALIPLLSLSTPGCGGVRVLWSEAAGRLEPTAASRPAPLTRPRARINALRENIGVYLKETERADDPAGFVLLDRHDLAFLAVRDDRGNWIRRLRHPSRISVDDLDLLLEWVAARSNFEGEHLNHRRRPAELARPPAIRAPITRHVIFYRSKNRTLEAHFGYRSPGAPPHVRAGRELAFLHSLWDYALEHGVILLALGLIGAGCVVLALVWLRKPPPEAAWHDDTRPAVEEPPPGPLPLPTTHEDFHAEIRKTVRIRPADAIHAALHKRFGPGPEDVEVTHEAPRPSASERLDPEVHEDVYEILEFEQERWNLPGFQSVYNPIQKTLSARDIDFTTGLSGQSMAEGDFLFAARYYKFAEAAENGMLTDIEGFARKFLEEISERFGPVESVLYLKNHKDQFHPVLSKKSSTFISGPAVQARHRDLDPLLLAQLRDGNCVVSEDGLRVYLPLSAREGMLGAVALRSDRPLYKSRELSALWYEIKKYGEYLHQAKIYEQATTDPYSTLFNGLQFQHDLFNDFSMKKEVRYTRSLLIVQFCGRSNLDHMRLLGMGLRSAFGRPFRLYRIAQDAAAILGPVMTAEEMEERFREFLNFVRAQDAVDISVGCALLDDDVTGTDEWFRRATRALEDSKKVGLNHFRTYRAPGDAAKFSLRRE